MRDKHQDRIKDIKRASRIEFGGIGGRAGTHVDKMERRLKHMGTKEWLEEVEEENEPYLDDMDDYYQDWLENYENTDMPENIKSLIEKLKKDKETPNS